LHDNYALISVKLQNNNLQTEYFEVTPPETGGGVRLADIVFLIDVSGSMGGEIADVRNNVNNFANALAASNIDFRLGLVRFGNSSGANPYLFNSGNLTDDVSTFQGFVNTPFMQVEVTNLDSLPFDKQSPVLTFALVLKRCFS